jgi:hypothetical protein
MRAGATPSRAKPAFSATRYADPTDQLIGLCIDDGELKLLSRIDGVAVCNPSVAFGFGVGHGYARHEADNVGVREAGDERGDVSLFPRPKRDVVVPRPIRREGSTWGAFAQDLIADTSGGAQWRQRQLVGWIAIEAGSGPSKARFSTIFWPAS